MFFFLFFFCHKAVDLSFPTGHWTHSPGTGRQSLNPWTTRTVLRRRFLREEEDERRRQKRVAGAGSGEGGARAASSRPQNLPLAGLWSSPHMAPPSPVLTQLDPESPRCEAQLLPPPAEPCPVQTKRHTSGCLVAPARAPGPTLHAGLTLLSSTLLLWPGEEAWSLLCVISDFHFINH